MTNRFFGVTGGIIASVALIVGCSRSTDIPPAAPISGGFTAPVTSSPATATPVPGMTAVATATPLPGTPTATPLPPGSTATPIPGAPTATPLPPGATAMPTTPGATATPLPPGATAMPSTGPTLTPVTAPPTVPPTVPPTPVPTPTQSPAPNVIVTPGSVSFNAPGGSQTVTASEAFYTGTYSATGCNPAGVANVVQASAPPNAFTITAVGAGHCTFSVTDATHTGNGATVSVTVTADGIVIDGRLRK